MKQNLADSLDLSREAEEAFTHLQRKIMAVDAMADNAAKNVDKDYATVLQTKLVIKVKRYI